jgi:hypothetical protein
MGGDEFIASCRMQEQARKLAKRIMSASPASRCTHGSPRSAAVSRWA